MKKWMSSSLSIYCASVSARIHQRVPCRWIGYRELPRCPDLILCNFLWGGWKRNRLKPRIILRNGITNSRYFSVLGYRSVDGTYVEIWNWMLHVTFKTGEELCSIGLCLWDTPTVYRLWEEPCDECCGCACARLLLSILNAFAQCTRSLYATRNAWYFQSVCSSRTVCLSYQQQSSNNPCSQQSPAPCQTRPPRLTNYLMTCRLYLPLCI